MSKHFPSGLTSRSPGWMKAFWRISWRQTLTRTLAMSRPARNKSSQPPTSMSRSSFTALIIVIVLYWGEELGNEEIKGMGGGEYWNKTGSRDRMSWLSVPKLRLCYTMSHPNLRKLRSGKVNHHRWIWPVFIHLNGLELTKQLHLALGRHALLLPECNRQASSSPKTSARLNRCYRSVRHTLQYTTTTPTLTVIMWKLTEL